MRKLPLLLLLFLFNAAQTGHSEVEPATSVTHSDVRQLYNDCELNGVIAFDAFKKSVEGYNRFKPAKPIIAICDFTKPSSAERFYVIDLKQKCVLYRSLVAHGKNSGELMAESFSNKPQSLQSSLGFYKIGSPIQSPKHGLALLLYGLEKNVNDNALTREIIIHGADYVCESFVKEHGRLGRSFGCPALPVSLMPEVAPVLQDGALLYIYAH